MRSIANKLAAIGIALHWVPSSLRSPTICEAFVLADPLNFHSVPPHLITKEMCYWFAAQSDLSACLLSIYIKDPVYDSPDKEHHPSALKQISQVNRWLKEANDEIVFGDMASFGKLESPWLDHRVIECMVARGAFGLIPEDKVTLDLCQAAVKKRPIDIIFCPEYTWPNLIEQSPKDIAFIPEDRLTESLCLIALTKSLQMLDYIPDSACTPSLMHHAVSIRTERQIVNIENTGEILLNHEISLLAHETVATSIKPLPAILENHLLDYIEQTSNIDGYRLLIKQLGDAGTPRALLNLYSRHSSINTFNIPADKLNAFRSFLYGNRSQMLNSRKQTMLLKYYGSDVIAGSCLTEDDWLVFKEVFGADKAIAYNPGMKRLMLSYDMDI
ncbi:hypothetical protein P5704_026670 (plasmid) [Pseudomonas sp. FeN3W]|nr:hypothetical protein P5704_026670 [Pseudomonas sp. FeN3W]